MESAAPPASATERLEEVSDTERAVYGDVTLLEMRTFLDAWARDRLGSAVADVRSAHAASTPSGSRAAGWSRRGHEGAPDPGRC